MVITILGSTAQEESIFISKNNKWAIQKKFETGDWKPSYLPYGYTKAAEGEIIIDEAEAVIVRRIYHDYLNGKGSYVIARELTLEGVPTRKGAEVWGENVVVEILTNEKYVGDLLLQKTFTTDTLPFIRKRNKGQKQKYFIQDSHEPIITREEAGRVREIMDRRREEKEMVDDTGKYNNRYPFTSKIICGECGSVFRRYTEHHDRNKKCNWKCKRYIVDNRVCCKSGVVDDHQLEAAFIEIINRVIEKPEVIETRPPINPAAESTELKKLTMQITSGLHKIDSEPSELAELLFKSAAEQYRLSTVDDFEYQTKKLKAVFQTHKPITAFDEDLFKATIKCITVETTNQLRFEMVNGVTLNTAYTLRGKGGIAHGKSSKNSIGDPCRSDL